MREVSFQQQCIIWFNNEFCLKTSKKPSFIFSVPNEMAMYLRGIVPPKYLAILYSIMAKLGLKKGVSDLIAIHDGKVIFIELKVGDNKQSKEQKYFEEVIKMHELEYHLVYDIENFKKIFKNT